MRTLFPDVNRPFHSCLLSDLAIEWLCLGARLPLKLTSDVKQRSQHIKFTGSYTEVNPIEWHNGWR